MIDNLNKKKLVILGGGTAGWMAANLFSKHLSEHFQIILIESPEIGIVGVGEGSTPSLKRFFENLEIEEADWMPKCNATYKLNIRFSGWSPQSGITEYSHPFMSQVDLFTKKAFYTNCLTRRLGLNVHTNPEDFFLNGILAKQKKSPIAGINFPFTVEYGYHFDSQLLGNYLAEYAKTQGVKHYQQKVVDVVQSPNGNITKLILDSGLHLEADFFIDCSGFASVLMQKTLNVPFKSFNDNLFNDSAVVMPSQITDKVPVETLSTALSNGWAWKIPLTNRYGNGYVYSSSFLSKDKAELELIKLVGSSGDKQKIRHLKMKVGQLKKHWQNNCLALGLSQGFIEPLEATALHLVQVSIELFIQYFKDGGFSNEFQTSYNEKISERFERVRDYIVAHYKLNTRSDSHYWQANRENLHLSDSLRHILDVWYRRGNLELEIERQKLETHFNAASWHCLLSGYGVYPKLAPNQPGKGDLYLDENIQSFLTRCAMNFKI
ncbi:tryptophan 7-halogenase [Catenovulum sp. 2E275]|uniref:tryptophan halogenase family protein n=1 Tax=Catenovulum sp. 2E275 TaxID=2980497 RepID=UPI0021D0C597|nr:tryptophan halogenase family protein [Catenovulum sp. 2E275]MCU4675494.1 tryptophan 7-halogenase [Catenovulum sp. 2E275]